MPWERYTSIAARCATVVLALVGLGAILSYTHSQSYRAGYCVDRECAVEAQNIWWPFSNPETTLPAQSVEVAAGVKQELRPPTAAGMAAQASSSTAQQPDPPPSVGGSNQSLPVTRQVPGVRPGVRPSSPPNSGGYGLAGESICYAAPETATEADIARCWLRVGDAYQAINMIEYARAAWNEALLIGSEVGGAQASLVAHLRLQGAMLERSCPTSQRSLERIAYGFDQTEDDGDIIDLEHRQRAMSALGYYNGDIDGAYGPTTRRAVRDFQNDMGYDQTGALTPSETVNLICHAALTARDTDAQNLLGVMFATGLGLEQNLDTALEWLEVAAERGHDGANFNLAVIYGTGTIQGSYRLCGLVESPERADAYLRRAARLDHGRALALRGAYGAGGDPAARWERISQRMIADAERSGDRFYLAWLRRVDEARRAIGQSGYQPGCYAAAGQADYASQGDVSGTRN